jgi:phenylacetate-CoA ligase
VRDTFGMTEAGMMGAEDAAGGGFRIWTDMFLIEVVDPETFAPVADGQVGSLVVTPLWTNNVTPFLRWSSGDLVTLRQGEDGGGPFSVFPLVKHAHRTTGFFKVRGINLNHSEFEDFMFRSVDVADFKAELVTSNDLDTLLLSIEARRGADGAAVAAGLRGLVRDTFGLTPEVSVLDSGTLAKEFESSVKTPRFVDRRQ